MAKPSFLPEEVTTYWDPDLGRVVGGPAVLQVAHAKRTGTQSIATAWVFTKLTGFSVTLTPKSNTSHFLLEAVITHSSGYFSTGFRFYRDDVDTGLQGNASSTRTSVAFGHTQYSANNAHEDFNVYVSAGTILHTVSGTKGVPITYDIYAAPYNASHPLTINYATENSDTASRIRTVSSFTVSEIEND